MHAWLCCWEFVWDQWWCGRELRTVTLGQRPYCGGRWANLYTQHSATNRTCSRTIWSLKRTEDSMSVPARCSNFNKRMKSQSSRYSLCSWMNRLRVSRNMPYTWKEGGNQWTRETCLLGSYQYSPWHEAPGTSFWTQPSLSPCQHVCVGVLCIMVKQFIN